MATNDPVSWRTIVYGTPVLAVDGTQVGTVREVLGSDAEDIFHGLRVQMAGRVDAMLLAEDVSELTRESVTTAKTAAALKALPDFDEPATYHLASVGWLRKHIGWKQDSKSDEEPG
jgi:hypothetical protein